MLIVLYLFFTARNGSLFSRIILFLLMLWIKILCKHVTKLLEVGTEYCACILLFAVVILITNVADPEDFCPDADPTFHIV
jgi:hypothetical protein